VGPFLLIRFDVIVIINKIEMRSQTLLKLLLMFFVLFTLACKAKRCASFESQDKDYKLKYDRHGRVKK